MINYLFLREKNFYLLMVLGVVLSLQHAWLPGFFADGYLYATFGKNAAEKGFWLIPHFNNEVYQEFFHHTPFVFILEGLFFKVFGASYVSARIFSSIFYLLSGSLIYQLTRKINNKLAYFSCFLFFTIPPLFKKVRFPNIDIPLMLFLFVAFLLFLKAREKDKFWYLNGVVFGLALLTKGPLGFLIPICQLCSLLWLKELDRLKNYKPWLGLIIGLMIFSVWPICLYFTNNFHIFEKWLDFTFLHTIKDSRGIESPFYAYFIFLFKQAPIWFFLALVGVIKSFQKKGEDKIIQVVSIHFLVILIMLSIPKFKYSNYLIINYPFMAILAAYPLTLLLSKLNQERMVDCGRYLVIMASLIILTFPITNKTKRDTEIHDAFLILKKMEKIPKILYLERGSYGFWELSGKLTFDGYDTKVIMVNKLTTSHFSCHDCILVSKNKNIENEKISRVFTLRRFETYLYMPNEDIKIKPTIIL